MSATPCVEWDGARDTDGYGRIQYDGQWRSAHRLFYEANYGPIPKGLVIDHLCRNRSCINPLHMEAVTSVENTMRGVGWGASNARKTQCKRGHPFDSPTGRIRPDGHRECVRCRRLREAQYRRDRAAIAAAEATE